MATNPTPHNRAEYLAELVIMAILPEAKLTYRSEQSHGEWDFDLEYPNGTSAAVEVTEAADQLRRWMSAKIHSKKDGGSTIHARRCRKSWVIVPMLDPKAIPAIRKNADEYLAKVEETGWERFRYFDAHTERLQREAGLDKFRHPQVPRCVEDICFDLKILSGSAFSSERPPKIFISPPPGSGWVTPSRAIEAGLKESQKEDNKKKLEASKAAERHLAVYIDAMNGLPWIALTEAQPPEELSQLPGEITHIWLIGHSGERNGSEFVVWRADKKEHWRSQRVVIPQDQCKAS